MVRARRLGDVYGMKTKITDAKDTARKIMSFLPNMSYEYPAIGKIHTPARIPRNRMLDATLPCILFSMLK